MVGNRFDGFADIPAVFGFSSLLFTFLLGLIYHQGIHGRCLLGRLGWFAPLILVLLDSRSAAYTTASCGFLVILSPFSSATIPGFVLHTGRTDYMAN